MKNTSSVNNSVNIKHISHIEIKARLIALNQSALAREWRVSRSYISHLIAGRKLYSRLMSKLARRIRVPEDELRGYLADCPHEDNADPEEVAAA